MRDPTLWSVAGALQQKPCKGRSITFGELAVHLQLHFAKGSSRSGYQIEIGGCHIFHLLGPTHHEWGRGSVAVRVCYIFPTSQSRVKPDRFSCVLLSFLLLYWPPLFLPFTQHLFALVSPRKMLCSVEQGAQHRAWRGAGSGWTFPQSSRKFLLPENLRAKDQV